MAKGKIPNWWIYQWVRLRRATSGSFEAANNYGTYILAIFAAIIAAYGFRVELAVSDPIVTGGITLLVAAAIIIVWRFLFSAPLEMQSEAVKAVRKKTLETEQLRIQRERLALEQENTRIRQRTLELNDEGAALQRNADQSQRRSKYSEIDSGLPKLQPLMFGGNVFTPDNIGNDTVALTGIALDAKIWNIGGPSVATDWSLQLVFGNGKSVKAQLSKIPPKLTLGAGTSTHVVICESQSLVDKTASVPISRVPIMGILLFYARVDKSDVLNPATRLLLTVKDIRGREATVEQLMAEWLQHS